MTSPLMFATGLPESAATTRGSGADADGGMASPLAAPVFPDCEETRGSTEGAEAEGFKPSALAMADPTRTLLSPPAAPLPPPCDELAPPPSEESWPWCRRGRGFPVERDTGVLNGRGCKEFTAILRWKESVDVLCNTNRSCEQALLIIGGETQVVFRDLSKSSFGRASELIFWASISRRIFFAWSSLFFRALLSSLAIVTLATMRPLRQSRLLLVGEAESVGLLLPSGGPSIPQALPVGDSGSNPGDVGESSDAAVDHVAPPRERAIGEPGGLNCGDGGSDPGGLLKGEAVHSSSCACSSSHSWPMHTLSSFMWRSNSSAPVDANWAYLSTLSSAGTGVVSSSQAGFPSLSAFCSLRRFCSLSCMTWSNCVSSKAFPNLPNSKGCSPAPALWLSRISCLFRPFMSSLWSACGLCTTLLKKSRCRARRTVSEVTWKPVTSKCATIEALSKSLSPSMTKCFLSSTKPSTKRR
mmetsp:Transcript_15681/g.39866  ORF Transcript_15681/g.39866 Transcript_15681/m.39866 type:complete len:470 (-) Transcript_15681:546-1955(-)